MDPSDYYYYDYDGDYYTEDDLDFILIEPVIVDGVVRVAVALDKPGSYLCLRHRHRQLFSEAKASVPGASNKLGE